MINKKHASLVLLPIIILFSVAAITQVDYPRQIKNLPTIDPRTYGAKIDGTTDDTTALTNALTASLASGACIILPSGTMKITSTISVTSGGFCIIGQGENQTFINANIGSHGAIFNFGTFSTTAAPPWVMNSYARLENLTLENTAQANVSNTGTRTTRGVQSNGYGHFSMLNVQFSGFEYGFVAPYGSDFDRFARTWCDRNDVCIYMGPASEQFEILATEGHTNGEVFVCDGCYQGSIHDNHLVDSMTADITFEREQPTRLGWTPMSINSYDPYSEVTVSDNWLETGAGFGGITTWQEYRRILFKNSSGGFGSYPRHVTIRDLQVTLGNTNIAAMDANPHSIVEFQSGKFIDIENVDIIGDRRTANFYSSGGNGVNVANVTVEDGYSTSVPMFGFSSGDYISNSFTYTQLFKNTSPTGSIPASCFNQQFWYDTTIHQWLGCGGIGVDSVFKPFLQTLQDSTTVNAVQASIYGGTQSSNVGNCWWQNGGNPVDHLNYICHDSAGNPNITLNPAGGLAGGATSIGSVSTGFLNMASNSQILANLGTPGNGIIIYCSDCKNKGDGVTPGNTCVSGGTGTLAIRNNGAWYCM